MKRTFDLFDAWASKVAVSETVESGMGSPCWIWRGGMTSRVNGYGQLWSSVDKKMRLAHRVGYEMCVGPIPDGMFICHKCDNRSCVAPHHMFVGTQIDNVRDMERKGRSVHVGVFGDANGSRRHPGRLSRGERHSAVLRERCVRGTAHPSSKMSDGEVALIKMLLSLPEEHRPTQIEIASTFGVCQTVVSKIGLGRIWRHV